MTILYVETNLLVGVATGRERDIEPLLAHVARGLKLAIPGVCCFEALGWLEGETRRRREFDHQISQQLGQSRRNVVSGYARTLVALLSAAQLANFNLLKSTNSRLLGAIYDVSRVAEVIEVGPAVLGAAIGSAVIGELTDNLILHCVLSHAARFPEDDKAFLSGNSKDFGGEDVKQALREAGIGHYFTTVSDVLGWLGSLAPRGSEA